MKNKLLFFCIALAMSVSCSVKETGEMVLDLPIPDGTFYAVTETIGGHGTKVFADEKFRVLWDADDRVSIFNQYTYNQQYKFSGETGANAGAFKVVPNDDFVTGNELPDIYAVYPYQESTKISNDEELTVVLPSTQYYRENSFGLGANTMISASSNRQLLFKNMGGLFILKLYGEGSPVSAVVLKGNNGELLAGQARIIMPIGEVPQTTLIPGSAVEEVALVCSQPVELNSTSAEYKEFWFVLPPVVFSKGFTVTVVNNKGKTFQKSTSKSLEIIRNNILKMSPFQVSFEADPVNPIIENPSIADIYGMEDGEKVHFSSVLAYAAGSRSFVIGDESGENFVHVYQGTAPESIVNKGDLVEVTAEKTVYCGMTELTNPQVTVKSSGNVLPAINYSDITEQPDYHGNKVVPVKFEAYVNTTHNDYYTFNYANIAETGFHVFIYWPKSDFTEYVERKISATGFFVLRDDSATGQNRLINVLLDDYEISDIGFDSSGIELKVNDIELGTFKNTNDYAYMHEFVKGVYNKSDGSLVFKWLDGDSAGWYTTDAATSLGFKANAPVPDEFKFELGNLIYDSTDPQDSFGGHLTVFKAGDLLWPSPNVASEYSGVNWFNMGTDLMFDKNAKVHVSLKNNNVEILGCDANIKVLSSGNSVKPRHQEGDSSPIESISPVAISYSYHALVGQYLNLSGSAQVDDNEGNPVSISENNTAEVSNDSYSIGTYATAEWSVLPLTYDLNSADWGLSCSDQSVADPQIISIARNSSNKADVCFKMSVLPKSSVDLTLWGNDKNSNIKLNASSQMKLMPVKDVLVGFDGGALYGSAALAAQSIPAFSVPYNSSLALDFIKIKVTSNDTAAQVGLGELTSYYPNVQLTYELLNYTKGASSTQESLFGIIEGNVFYPAYIGKDNVPQRIDNDQVGLSAVGRAPIIMVKLIDVENNNRILLCEYFKIMITNKKDTNPGTGENEGTEDEPLD